MSLSVLANRLTEGYHANNVVQHMACCEFVCVCVGVYDL